jgi:hypothetical protein
LPLSLSLLAIAGWHSCFNPCPPRRAGATKQWQAKVRRNNELVTMFECLKDEEVINQIKYPGHHLIAKTYGKTAWEEIGRHMGWL